MRILPALLLALAIMAFIVVMLPTSSATVAPGPDTSAQKYRAIDNNGMKPSGVPNAGFASTPPIWNTYSSIQGSGSTVPGPGGQVEDDEWSTTCISLGFTFEFYGVNQNCAWVAGEGMIGFGGSTPANPPAQATDYPNTANPDNIIAPMWGMQNGAFCGGDIKYRRDTASNPDRFIVQWNNVMMWSNGPDSVGCANNVDAPPHPKSTFQVVLEEDTNNIYFYIRHYESNNNNAGYCDRLFSSGIENAAGTQGLRYFRTAGCPLQNYNFVIDNRVVRLLPNHGPDVNAATLTVDEDDSVSITLGGSDADGDAIASYRVDTSDLNFGTASISGATLTYTPGADEYGDAGSVDVYAKDTLGTEGEKTTIPITVNAVNDPPSFTPGSAVSVDMDSAAYSGAWATDIVLGPEGDYKDEPDTATFTVDPTSGAGLFSAAPTVSESGNLAFTPAAGAYGTATFQVSLSDGVVSTATSQLTIEIVQTYVAAAALDAEWETDEDSTIIITLTADNPGGESLTYGIDTEPTQGSLGPVAGDTVAYTPAADFFGSDSFDFTVDDGTSQTTGTITLQILPINDPPTCCDDTIEAGANVITAIDAENLLANDQDIDSSTLSITGVSGTAEGGTVSLAGDTIQYEPALDFEGMDSFTYELSDGSATIDVRVTVNVIPAALLPPNAAFTFSEGILTEGLPVDFLDASTPGGSPIVAWSWDFGDGNSDEQNPSFTFPEKSFYTVTLTVTDEAGKTSSKSKNVAITNAPPVAAIGPYESTVNIGSRVTLTSNSIDEDALDLLWEFNGETFAEETISIKLTDAGQATISLTVTDVHGFSDQTAISITVLPPKDATRNGGGGSNGPGLYAREAVRAPPEPTPAPIEVPDEPVLDLDSIDYQENAEQEVRSYEPIALRTEAASSDTSKIMLSLGALGALAVVVAAFVAVQIRRRS